MEEDPRLGAMVADRYRIDERLAAGGMGAVYRGTQVALDRAVAIKFLHGWMSLDVRARRRFEVEAQAMAKLRHPHCAQVLDFGLDGDTPYLVMELVEGETLGDLLERGPLPPARAVNVARQALSALAHAHERGITHRDIKPDNLMIGEATGVGDHVRILDFGIARLTEDGGALTAGMAIGTPKYMAPEQASGEAVDAGTDLYALAIVLFETLAGEPPFVADETVDILLMHRQTPPPAVADKAPSVSISAELDLAIRRALAKRPEDRFQHAVEFAEALAACPEAAALPRASSQGLPTPAPPLPAPVAPGEPSQLPFPAAPPGEHAGVPIPPSAPPPGAPASPPPHGSPSAGWRALTWLRQRPLTGLAVGATAGAMIVAVALADPGEGGGANDAEVGAPTAASAPSGSPELERLAEMRKLVEDRPDRAVSPLERITGEHPDAAEAWYLLGRAYYARRWWSKGLDAFERALTLDDAYRHDATLIETVTDGFISRSRRAHERIAAFLAEEIGEPARPHLEELAREASSRRIRERAAAALEKF